MAYSTKGNQIRILVCSLLTPEGFVMDLPGKRTLTLLLPVSFKAVYQSRDPIPNAHRPWLEFQSAAHGNRIRSKLKKYAQAPNHWTIIYNDTGCNPQIMSTFRPVRQTNVASLTSNMRHILFQPERFLLATFLILALSACGGGGGGKSGGGSSLTTSSQTLSMSINAPSSPPPTQQDFQNAVNLAAGVGVKGVLLTWTWSSLEPSPQMYDLSQMQPAIQYFSASGFKILLGIQVINTVAKEVPSDLQAVAFDSPEMMSRFHALLDQMTPSLSSNVRYISIGNEVDVYLSTHAAEWAPYQAFYEDGLTYLHQKAQGIQIGVTVTYLGASGTLQAQVSELNSRSDVVILTYYPLHGDFQVNSPASPATDFPAMIALSGGKPVVLQEVGYPSDSLNGSSETMEAQFVTSALNSWRRAGSKIPYFNYFLEHDFSQSDCNIFVQFYGLPNDPAFQSYLCSLGLRRVDGSAKPAWNSFAMGAQ